MTHFFHTGTSVLEAARRIWRQLILVEDAMLVYRVVRDLQREEYFILMLGMFRQKIFQTTWSKSSLHLRNLQVVDKDSGRVDLRYNPLVS